MKERPGEYIKQGESRGVEECQAGIGCWRNLVSSRYRTKHCVPQSGVCILQDEYTQVQYKGARQDGVRLGYS